MPGVPQRNNREHNRSRPKEKSRVEEIFPEEVGKPEHKTGCITRKSERRLDPDDREELSMNEIVKLLKSINEELHAIRIYMEQNQEIFTENYIPSSKSSKEVTAE